MAILLFLFAKTSLIVVLCAVALYALLIHPVWNFWWIEKRRVRQFFFTGLLFIGCLLIGYKAWPTNEQEQPQIVQSQPSPPVSATPLSVLLTPSPSQQASPCANVYEPFRQACKRFKDRLGNPSKDAEGFAQLYHAEHEKATVILISDKKPVYLLDKRKGNRLVILDDPHVGSNAFWWNDAEVRRKFKEKRLGAPPRGLSFPFGPIAKGWFNNPEDWAWIGWKQSHCMYEDDTARVQDFEHGVIIGSVRETAESGDGQVGRILVLLTDDNVLKWDFEPYDTKPRCDVPRPSNDKEIR